MRTTIHALLGVAGLVFAAACGNSRAPTASPPPVTEAIRVEAVGNVFNRGTTVQLDLVNDSTLAASSGACATALDVLIGGDAWGRVQSYDATCDAILYTVQPGQRQRVVARLPLTLPSGTYRTVHQLGIGNVRVAYLRYSAAFLVR